MQNPSLDAVEKGIIAYQDDYGVWSTAQRSMETVLTLLQVNIRSRVTGQLPKHPPLLQYRAVDQISPSEVLLATYWHRRPYVYLYFVFCEDLDGYRLLVKQKIKSWVDAMIERQLEWLVIYVPIGSKAKLVTSGKAEAEKNFQKVLQRIRGDLPTKSSNRACYLKIHDDRPLLERYDEIVVPMQESLAHSFEQRRVLYEDELRKLEANKAYAGWNYFTYFATKEGLAFTFEHFKLFDEALREYSELQQAYDTTSTKQELFDDVCRPEHGDDSIPIFKNDRKDFRLRIINSTITKFDFSRYLFAQQAWLLHHLNRSSELLKDGLQFWRKTNTAMLTIEDESIKTFFSCWGFHFCTQLARLTEATVEKHSQQKTELHVYLGTLYQDAKTKLRKLYERAKEFPESYKVSNEIIIVALSTEEEFLRMSADVANSAHTHFQSAGRYRHSARLLFEVAECQMKLGEYEEVEAKLKSMCGLYFTGGWPDLLFYARDKLASCQKQLNHTAEYTASCLEILASEAKYIQERKTYYMQELATQGSLNLKQVVARSMYPIFKADCGFAKGNQVPMGEEIGIECALSSILPGPFAFDRACLRFIDTHPLEKPKGIKKRNVLFEKKQLTCNGTIRFTFSGKFPSRGVYYAERVWLQRGKVILSHKFSVQEIQKLIVHVKDGPTEAVLQLFKPDVLVLGSQEFLKIHVSTNGDSVRNLALHLQSSSDLKIGSGGPDDLSLQARLRTFSVKHKADESSADPEHDKFEGDSDDEMETEQSCNVTFADSEKDHSSSSSTQSTPFMSSITDNIPIEVPALGEDLLIEYTPPAQEVQAEANDSVSLEVVDLDRLSEVSPEDSPQELPEQTSADEANILLPEDIGFVDNTENFPLDTNENGRLDDGNMEQASESNSMCDPNEQFGENYIYDSFTASMDTSPPNSMNMSNNPSTSANGTLDFGAGATGPLISVSIDRGNGDVTKLLKNLADSTFKAEKLRSNSTLELVLPVLIKSEEDVDHHISVEIQYSNQSGDVFRLFDQAWLGFKCPFEVVTYVDYRPPLAFLRYIITSRVGVPITIESQGYSIPRQYNEAIKSIKDMNGGRNFVILPRDRVSFLYVIEQGKVLAATESADSTALSVDITTHYFVEQKDQQVPRTPHSHTQRVTFSQIHNLFYDVHVRYPSVFGENEIHRVEFVVSIYKDLLSDQKEYQAHSLQLQRDGFHLQDQYFWKASPVQSLHDLVYQINSDKQMWQLAGRIRGGVQTVLQEKQSQSLAVVRVTLDAIPLVPGRISLPTLALSKMSGGRDEIRASTLAPAASLSDLLVRQPHRRLVDIAPPPRTILSLTEKTLDASAPKA